MEPVVFGHHDPRGSRVDPRYAANEAFPTDPLGLGPFEEWNFDGAWDSSHGEQVSGDVGAFVSKESAEKNSGVEFLGLLARYGGTYICGHAHYDDDQYYPVGSRLGPHAVKRPYTSYGLLARPAVLAARVRIGGIV